MMNAMTLCEVNRLYADLECDLKKEPSWTVTLHNNGILDAGFSSLNHDIMHQCNLLEFPREIRQNGDGGVFEDTECKTVYSDDPEWYSKLVFRLDINTADGLSALRRIAWFLDSKYRPIRDERYDFYCATY